MNVKITQFIGKVQLGVKRNAPELLLGAGLLTGTATIVFASKATLKAKELTAEFNDAKASLEYDLLDEAIDDNNVKHEIKKTYTKYALSLTKEYAIPVGLYAATVGLIFSSYKIQKNRQMALSAALAACTTAYTTLVNKLKKGAVVGLTAKEVLDGIEGKEVVNPETGEVTIEKVQGDPIDSIYKIRFDRYSPVWEKDKFQNESTLRSEENWANDRLRLRGFVFLNEIYDRLGFAPIKAGQMVGWKLDGNGDGFIDFGIKDCEEYEDVRFDHNAFDLNFNVDGDILTDF